ncbi:hypothetical protein BCR34DRAFT_146747 [Clohesyomyces aquaticus]|uniref:Uncharacterized protein n=1 Tax=Clohesyomyces aquaticus TaxID=1231657 RepID=A0A1Y1YKS4_9PLEO|nr:hypothetical protein BCR34DRAFT_146747 [Clohesyomyces aquaticus]
MGIFIVSVPASFWLGFIVCFGHCFVSSTFGTHISRLASQVINSQLQFPKMAFGLKKLCTKLKPKSTPTSPSSTSQSSFEVIGRSETENPKSPRAHRRMDSFLSDDGVSLPASVVLDLAAMGTEKKEKRRSKFKEEFGENGVIGGSVQVCVLPQLPPYIA